MAEALTRADGMSPWVYARPALLALAIMVAFLGWYEWWSRRHGKPRISDYTQQAATWVQWLGITLLGLLWWHLFRGGPLSRKVQR
jgi:hypothetical protein